MNVDARAALINAGIALAAVVGVAGFAEFRRRRRRSVWQFTLREVLWATVLVAGFCAYVANMYRSTAAQQWAANELQQIVNEWYFPRPSGDDPFDELAWLIRPDIILGVQVDSEPPASWFWETICGDAIARPANVVSLWLILNGSWPDQAERPLESLPHLRTLCLSHCGRITDEALRQIASLQQLQELSLPLGGVTSDQLVYLAPLKGLRRLGLSHNNLTDDGLRHLHGLRHLEVLEISNNQTTDSGIHALQQALPNLLILDD